MVVRYGQLAAKGFVANPAPEVGKRSGYEKKAFNLLRTLEGARNFCAIRSHASTLRKQDRNVLAGLRQLFEGHA